MVGSGVVDQANVHALGDMAKLAEVGVPVACNADRPQAARKGGTRDVAGPLGKAHRIVAGQERRGEMESRDLNAANYGRRRACGSGNCSRGC